MSIVVRQSNLFAGEDFTQIYKSFKDINFTAYDFESIRDALLNYIRVYYPEDFNDYIESSEFIAVVELLAYLGTSLSFRSDLNARESIMDTAERRDSIIRLAKMINYQTRRNVAATGMLKVTAIRTDQPIIDSNGNSLSNVQVRWNDPNNIMWYDQFVSVANAAFNPTNPFGSPTKSKPIAGVTTDLYELNNVTGLNVAYNLNVNVNGESVPVDIINPDLTDQIVERHPNQSRSFNLIYRNDGTGLESANTGFFLKFIQGKLQKFDEQFDFPEPNRIWDIPSRNVNNSDVFVQEINTQGEVIAEWTQVPSVSGSNVIYNSINFDQENIFEVLSELNDKISIKFPDGNFGTVPTGIFRVWYRQSLGRKIVFRPESMSDLKLTIPYRSSDNQEYRLTISFGLVNTVANGVATETDEQIRTRAPQLYYTQDRMINNADYNLLPLAIGNTVLKVRSINRTYSGHSRFALLDPTGFNKSITVLGEDGAIYNFTDNQSATFDIVNSLTGNVYLIAIDELSNFLNSKESNAFFNNTYLPQLRESRLPLDDFTLVDPNANYGWWKTSPNKTASSTGFFITSSDTSITNWPYGTNNDNVINTSDIGPFPAGFKFIKAGASVKFKDPITPTLRVATSVKSVSSQGTPFDPQITLVGPIEFGSPVQDLWRPVSVIPAFRTTFYPGETTAIETEMSALQSFGLSYDVIEDEWNVIPFSAIDETAQFDITDPSASWHCIVKYIPATATTPARFEFISRGNSIVFESQSSVRFYWDPAVLVDGSSSLAKADTIEVLRKINDGADGNPLSRTISWSMYQRFMQNDGFVDSSKVKVAPSDYNSDSYSDYPDSFLEIVGPNDEVIIEKYTDNDGYLRTRLWSGIMSSGTGYDSFGDPITSVALDYVNIAFVTDKTIPLSDADMFIFSSESVLDAIRAQLEVDLNNPLLAADASTFIASLEPKYLKVGMPGSDFSLANQYFSFTVVQGEVTATVEKVRDNDITGYNGKSFTQNTAASEPQPFSFKWSHFAPSDKRVDPSKSNIIDTVVLTEAYYSDVLSWKNSRSTGPIPRTPTTESLRLQFAELNSYKSISDEMVYNSGKFKVLFGTGASPELQAKFKVVKIPTSNISDNELKTRVIQAIDAYFDIRNWDFGEKFYYTELAAYIHTQLSRYLSSVVIVPVKQSSEFGNLFEIGSESNELFISTATVSNVEIVNNFTETNLRM